MYIYFYFFITVCSFSVILKQLITTVGTMSNDIKYLIQINKTVEKRDALNDVNPNCTTLPCKTQADLEDFNTLLEDEAVFKSVVSFLMYL